MVGAFIGLGGGGAGKGPARAALVTVMTLSVSERTLERQRLLCSISRNSTTSRRAQAAGKKTMALDV
ncbi:hypothetical protein [Rubrivivax sp. A210]|uniref:hypothetical protein n=1 Tax=Rubrivivax sp. A210 TaxID=2772301 RepID=UPI00191B4400|nr:hypothetical protein [Rubrivivax sp. A210]